MREVIAALSAMGEPGSFVGKNHAPANALSLEVKGFGLLPWPLTQKTVQQLIALAQPAQFGWRDQTLLDKVSEMSGKFRQKPFGLKKLNGIRPSIRYWTL